MCLSIPYEIILLANCHDLYNSRKTCCCYDDKSRKNLDSGGHGICNVNKTRMFVVQLAQNSTETGSEKFSLKFSSLRSSYKGMYLGSRPPSDGRWESWLYSTSASPYPIRYTLRPLAELLDPDCFIDSDMAELKARKAKSVSAFQLLCGVIHRRSIVVRSSDLRSNGREFNTRQSHYRSVRTGMGDGRITSVCNQPPRPTQPPTLCGTGSEYRPKCDNALRLGSKARWLIPFVDKRVGGR